MSNIEKKLTEKKERLARKFHEKPFWQLDDDDKAGVSSLAHILVYRDSIKGK